VIDLINDVYFILKTPCINFTKVVGLSMKSSVNLKDQKIVFEM